MNKEFMKQEALKRLDILTETLNLNPNIKKYYKKGKLYYSYITGGGLLGSIDTIGYNPGYEEIVRKFEETYNCIVYHVIEDTFGMLSLLYVSGNEEEWEYERPDGKYVPANVYVFDNEKLRKNQYVVAHEEFGTIVCTSKDGALVRIG
ncbi:MAG: hypothetical protein PUB46_08490 [Lachnospiraceae bacterium]|nr:hypothetical protein [Lachnospiraceae bacterium]MDD6170101.1 hypothetical protein [Lachnospiraceae bacterium]MDY4840175.1 hypothetical protein [Lachnospiraceae bacterium]